MPEITELFSAGPRIRVVRDGPTDPDGRCVVYWMQRSQRGTQNPALDLAIEVAAALKLPVLAVFGLTANYPSANRRHYRFLVDGLPETAAEMGARGVPLVVRLGNPDAVVDALAVEVRAALVVGDENPVHVGRAWRESLAKSLRVPYLAVDGDVVVPSSLFPREEYAARTIRPKIGRVIDEYLTPSADPPALVRWNPADVPAGERVDDAEALLTRLKVGGVGEVAGYRGGPVEARRRLDRFVRERLARYETDRNLPTPYMTSELSAHLHYGCISPLTAVLAVRAAGGPPAGVDSFVEEIVVRRELSVNFVARNPNYDRIEGCPNWALATLEKHARDPRPFQYSPAALEAADTHDPVWNASQKEMVLSGRMHNYLRMYWAKKVLEWSPDAASAFATLRELNDRYEMDGRDPNGYTGIAWAVGGKHDRPWPERPIYGTVRSMSADGLRRKFDTDAYIAYVRSLERGAASQA